MDPNDPVGRPVAADNPGRPVAADNPGRPMAAGRATILVVDDNATNLKLAADVLSADGYDVLTAGDTEEAGRVLAERLPALILMDIALPGMDGLTYTRQLKSDPRTRGIVIVALTAFAMLGDEAKAREAGCDGYITKPLDTRRLPQQVAEYLRAAARPA